MDSFKLPIFHFILVPCLVEATAAGRAARGPRPRGALGADRTFSGSSRLACDGRNEPAQRREAALRGPHAAVGLRIGLRAE